MSLGQLTLLQASTETKKYTPCLIYDRVQGIKFNYYYTDCGTFKMDMLLVNEKYIKVLDEKIFLWHGVMVPMETLEEFNNKVDR
jgi:hypothetical protein